jgi:hypothetical protein
MPRGLVICIVLGAAAGIIWAAATNDLILPVVVAGLMAALLALDGFAALWRRSRR